MWDKDPDMWDKDQVCRTGCTSLNEKGKPFTLKADGLLARIIQHEYDHLDGILYIDRGDPDFKAKAEETMRRREERRLEKEKAKAAKAAKIAAKKAGK